MVANIDELKASCPAPCRSAWRTSRVSTAPCRLRGPDRGAGCLPKNEPRDGFAADYSVSGSPLGGAVARPGPGPYERLSLADPGLRVPEALHREGKLLWHALGAKTIELIHENVHVDAVRDDLDTLVLDADLLEAVLATRTPRRRPRRSRSSCLPAAEARRRPEVQGSRRAARRPQAERHQQGLLLSIEFLKELAGTGEGRRGRRRERETPRKRYEPGKAALTELFEETRNTKRPSWSIGSSTTSTKSCEQSASMDGRHTHAGEREVKKALRKRLPLQAAPGPGAFREGLRLHP